MFDTPYILDVLELSGFRAFLEPQQFDFRTKRCLAVFAPNGSGKSSIVDALEFMFSDYGTLERLGLRAINNQAGVAALAHNLAEEKKITPFVRIGFKFGNQKSEGSRTVLDSARIRPDIATDVKACFIVDPLIRGYALRRFVEEQKAEERYEDVARWLQLDPLVAVQRNLRALRQRAKAAAEDRSSLKRLDRQLAKRSGNAVMTWSEDEVLAYANSILVPLDVAFSLQSLDRTDAAFIRTRDRAKAEERQLGLESLRQLRRMTVVLYAEAEDLDSGKTRITGLIPDFEAAVAAQAIAFKKETEERAAAANAVFAELWNAAEPLFAEGEPVLETCPVCNTPIVDGTAGSIEGVRRHISKHRTELANYAKAKEVLDASSTTVGTAGAQVTAALEALKPLLTDEHAALQVPLSTYLDAAVSLISGVVPDAATLKVSLRELTKALDVSIKGVESKQGESTYVKVLSKLEEMIELKDEREQAVRLLSELLKLSKVLDAQAVYISGAIRKKVQALLDTLQEPINNIYSQIQGDRAAPIRLELPPEGDTNQQRLNLVIDFAANRAGVQPGGYLSDSQIHSLALAFRMAAIKRFNSTAPLIVLDDIVTSYDADHRRAIAALLAKEFTDFQFIITTHDERFFIYLKDQLGDKYWHYKRIVRLDLDFGPRLLDHRVTDAMIEARWHAGEYAANEMRQAEEEWLLRLCRDFGVDLRIRTVERAYSFERSELALALAGFLRDKGHTPPSVPGVNNRFLLSLQQGAIENFGSHFHDGPYGDGSIGDERTRWDEFKFFRDRVICPRCGGVRFKRPIGMNKAVCAKDGCETQFAFAQTGSSRVDGT